MSLYNDHVLLLWSNMQVCWYNLTYIDANDRCYSFKVEEHGSRLNLSEQLCQRIVTVVKTLAVHDVDTFSVTFHIRYIPTTSKLGLALKELCLETRMWQQPFPITYLTANIRDETRYAEFTQQHWC